LKDEKIKKTLNKQNNVSFLCVNINYLNKNINYILVKNDTNNARNNLLLYLIFLSKKIIFSIIYMLQKRQILVIEKQFTFRNIYIWMILVKKKKGGFNGMEFHCYI